MTFCTMKIKMLKTSLLKTLDQQGVKVSRHAANCAHCYSVCWETVPFLDGSGEERLSSVDGIVQCGVWKEWA